MAKTETEIKNIVRCAQNFVLCETPDVDFTNPKHLYIRWLDIEVELIAHSVFSKSFYRINHPRFGRFEGLLNSFSCNPGEFGISPGKPKARS